MTVSARWPWLSIRGSRTFRLQNVHFRAFASVDPWHRLRSHRSTVATGAEHTASDAVCSPPVGPLLRLEAQRWQGSTCRTMSEALFAVIITSDDSGRPDELSVRDVSVDDTRQGRSPAEHPPSLRKTLLPITPLTSRETCSKAVSHRSDGRVVSFSCSESLHTMRAARA